MCLVIESKYHLSYTQASKFYVSRSLPPRHVDMPSQVATYDSETQNVSTPSIHNQ